jgi:hypothetical protein
MIMQHTLADTGGGIDVAQRYGVDALGGKQPLRGVQDFIACVFHGWPIPFRLASGIVVEPAF